jgi:hypothetical protein
MAFLNRCIWTAASISNSAFVVSAAAQNGYVPANCANPSVVNGATYHYFAADAAGNHQEGDGTYNTATSTLTSTTIRDSSNSGSAVTFTSAPVVTMGGPVATDMLGIGTAIASGTSGSVLFVDSSGNLGQDNADFFWDNTNRSLFVGGGVSGSYYAYNTFTSSINFERGVLGWNTVANVLVLGTQKGSSGGTARDIWIEPSSNIVQQLNGSSAQSLRVFKTTDGSGNDEYGVFDWRTTSGVLTIGTAAAGTGTARELRLTSFGVNVLRGDPVTAGNFFAGNAGNDTLTGQTNVGVGPLSLHALTTGTNNVALGQNAGTNITTGAANFALGRNTLTALNAADGNVAIGSFVLQAYNDTVGYMTAIGTQTLYNKTAGGGDTAIGDFAGWTMTSGSNNTFIGGGAGYAITSGSNNTILGAWNGPAGSVSSIIGLSDGAGNLRVDYGYTNSGKWTFPADIITTGDLYTTDASFLIRTRATLSNGAAANAATLTNAPAAGNPTKWISIDDNGTTRKIPAW